MNATEPFATVVGYPETRIARTGRLSGRRLQRVIAYVHAHLAENVCLQNMAVAAGLSPFHFARLFKSTTGFTPHGYLVRIRVERVKELLSRCDRTMTEIAAEAGFADQSHMSKVFRRVMGGTPTEFRDTSTVPGQSGPLAVAAPPPSGEGAPRREAPPPSCSGVAPGQRAPHEHYRLPAACAVLDKAFAQANT
ncbi:MAG: helix-turn-helix domain-containing protein [Burkholderiales bacterium]